MENNFLNFRYWFRSNYKYCGKWWTIRMAPVVLYRTYVSWPIQQWWYENF